VYKVNHKPISYTLLDIHLHSSTSIHRTT